ncbi:MAG: hypothetical protein GYB65_15895 [Chloroflexi bacterium]|nr:hypothetical protein [Chloroflexota bacterium]
MVTESQTLGKPAALRNILYANIAFCMTFVALFVFAAGPIADFADVAWEPYLRLLGIGLAGFAGYVFYAARTLERRLVWVVFALDVAWVVGSYVLLALDALPITTEAQWALAVIADAVLLFAVLEYWALRPVQR